MTQKTFDGMGGHQGARSTTDEWLTPPEILRELGPFDLDPCATCGQRDHNQPWMTARGMYCKCDNGLSKDWAGRVFCNPPYGLEGGKWLMKLAKHGNGVALVFARTDVLWFQEAVFQAAHAVKFILGRLTFYRPDGTKPKFNGGAPSVLVAYGEENAKAIERCRMPGFCMRMRP